MSLRKKIALYFSLSTQIISGIVFILIYILFAEKREEEFQMRQKDKISVTLELLSQIRSNSNVLMEHVDLLTIHDLYDEKLLLFDSDKTLIYSSLDDITVHYSKQLLEQLNPSNKWIETKDGLYDVVGTYVESDDQVYYGLSKAYDNFGYSKLSFLKYTLIITFIFTSLLIIVVSNFLSKKITLPLSRVTKRISEYDFDRDFEPIKVDNSRDEVAVLTEQFNKLMNRINEVFSFQKHAIHHISHELKTPISVLVSNFEVIENEADPKKLKLLIKNQKEDTKSLSEIINSLLELSKAESGNELRTDTFRLDELIFDVAEELNNLYPSFHFHVDYQIQEEYSDHLTITANQRLIKSALTNLMQNCIQYAIDKQANITISPRKNDVQLIFENKGSSLTNKETDFLFQHFFRGSNSKGKRGFGLGLVFVKKIIDLHEGTITYKSENQTTNQFHITIPLR